MCIRDRFFLRHFERQAQALADQVGDHFDEVRTLFEQSVVGRCRLYGEDALQAAADPDRHGNERQFLLVNAEPVEKARLVGDAGQHYGAWFLQHHAENAFPRLIVDIVDASRMVDGMRCQIARLRVDDADHAEIQLGLVVQNAQHVVQGFPESERPAEDATDGVERGELQDVQLVCSTVAVGRWTVRQRMQRMKRMFGHEVLGR